MPKKQNSPDKVDCSPTKQFFVSMLTRDIELGDAILDLLDNCVDGAVRTVRSQQAKKADVCAPNALEGYWADIEFNKEGEEFVFVITDNCGGIPSEAMGRAFRMGKPKNPANDEKLPTVGVYGIGMKRALFKLGRNAEVLWRRSAGPARRVRFDGEWFDNEGKGEWELPCTVEPGNPLKEAGTRITVRELYPNISRRFKPDSPFLMSDFISQLEWQYSHIISRGFKVTCNGTVVKPRLLELLDARPGHKGGGNVVRPYVWRGMEDGVDMFVAVGLTGPLKSDSETEKLSPKTSLEAGITVICNDRVVLYNDKSPLTGWGGGPRRKGVPQYHTQFISIGGVACFSCDDPGKLPMTTTKRGVDENSPAYLAAMSKLREGLTIFTGYTHEWKKHLEKEKDFSKKSGRVSAVRLMEKYPELGERIPRNLPKPPASKTEERSISYRKHKDDIALVSRFLHQGDPNQPPRKVGEASFDHCWRLAKEEQGE